MKYIVVYAAKNRKNAKRHVETIFGRVRYYNSVEEARSNIPDNHRYIYQIMTAKYELVEEVSK